MREKLVSVFDYTPPKREEITDDHIYLLGSYISVLNTEYCLSNLSGTAGFVRTLKSKTNKYRDFLESEVYNAFKQAYDLDPENMDKLFENMKTRNKFQVEEFLKQMCSE